MRVLGWRFVVTAAVALAAAGCRESAPAPKPVTPPAARISAFAISATEVAPGDRVTLTWEIQDAEAVSLRDLGGEEWTLPAGAETGGSLEATISEDTGFILTAWGKGGTDRRVLTVVVRKESPTLLFAASPARIFAGEDTALVWNVPDAPEVVVRTGPDIVHRTDATAGSTSVSPAFTTTYTLEAGGRSADVTVEVRPAILSFTASALSVDPGEPVTLHWRAGGASRLVLSSDGRDVLTEITERGGIVEGSFEDVVPSDLPASGVIAYTLMVDDGNETVEKRIEVNVSANPTVVKFDVPSFARAGESFVVVWQVDQADRLEIVMAGEVAYAAVQPAQIKSGSVRLSTPEADSEISLRATNARGGETIVTRTVGPVGIPALLSFGASPAHLPQGGDPVTLSWEIPNARRVSIVADGRITVARVEGTGAELASVDVYPNRDTTYEIRADNTLGDFIVPATTDVTVGAPATLTFNPATAPAGAKVTITSTSVTNGGDVMGLPRIDQNVAGTSFVDISETGIDAQMSWWDYDAQPFDLGDTFHTRIFGQDVSSNWISISPNGWFAFYYDWFWENDFGPFALPTQSLLPLAIAPLWCDVYMSDGRILYQVDGTDENRRLIVQWDKAMYDWNGMPLTFQAQVYADGRIVFAYKDVTSASPVAAVGVLSGDQMDALSLGAAPQDGEVYTLFGRQPLPATFRAHAQPFFVRQFIGTSGAFIDLEAVYPVLPPDQFSVTEANALPASGAGQWFEVENNTQSAIDLMGWDIDFGNGNTHTIGSSLEIPAGGRILLAQTSTAGDGLTVDYTWGTTPTMSAGSIVGLSIAGGVYTHLAVPSGLRQGVAWQGAPLDSNVWADGSVTSLECGAHGTSTYGTLGQLGTPGQPNTTCPEFQGPVSISPAFEALANVGTEIMFNDSDADVQPVSPNGPIVVGRVAYPTLYVGTNGWISFHPLTCTGYPCFDENSTWPDLYLPNGFIAPYWDDLEMAPGTAWWIRRDPDATPNSGDEYTVISWENVRRYFSFQDDLNFQVKFFDSGRVEFHYATMTGGDGQYATTWLEHPTGLAAYVINVESTFPGIQSSIAFRFQPY